MICTQHTMSPSEVTSFLTIINSVLEVMLRRKKWDSWHTSSNRNVLQVISLNLVNLKMDHKQ